MVIAYESAEAATECVQISDILLPCRQKSQRLVGVLTIDVRRILQHELRDAARQAVLNTAPFILRDTTAQAGSTSCLASRPRHWCDTHRASAVHLRQPSQVWCWHCSSRYVGEGNTGNQAATTITRALALGDVLPRDVWKCSFGS